MRWTHDFDFRPALGLLVLLVLTGCTSDKAVFMQIGQGGTAKIAVGSVPFTASHEIHGPAMYCSDPRVYDHDEQAAEPMCPKMLVPPFRPVVP